MIFVLDEENVKSCFWISVFVVPCEADSLNPVLGILEHFKGKMPILQFKRT